MTGPVCLQILLLHTILLTNILEKFLNAGKTWVLNVFPIAFYLVAM